MFFSLCYYKLSNNFVFVTFWRFFKIFRSPHKQNWTFLKFKSRMLPLGKLQLNSLVSVFISILLSFCSNCFISPSRRSLLQYGLSLTSIWPPKVRKIRKTRKRLGNILLLALVIIFIRFLCEALTFFQDYFSSPSFVMFYQTN